MTLQIGITGGIGCGKSIVCKVFQALGVSTYDADTQAKKIMTTDALLVGQIKKEFGDLAYTSNGTLDRHYLSQSVFESPKKTAILNQLVHPRVAYDYEQWVKEHSEEAYVIKEAALLYEAGSYKQLDKMIVVSAPESIRVKRIMERDPQRSEAEIKSIIKSQLPEAEKLSRADFTIVNDESQLIIPQVLRLHKLFTGSNG